MTQGTKCYILLRYLHTTFLMITGHVLVKICKNILGGLIPSFFLLNTALINYLADVQNADVQNTPRLER